ncbi:unnamed protein product [Somion occarium]|uniref:Uncharacterized protein n=1 Tax=Somion occarium TaxID=3059160 RepID=A0ABP1DZN1_9APHY
MNVSTSQTPHSIIKCICDYVGIKETITRYTVAATMGPSLSYMDLEKVCSRYFNILELGQSSPHGPDYTPESDEQHSRGQMNRLTRKAWGGNICINCVSVTTSSRRIRPLAKGFRPTWISWQARCTMVACDRRDNKVFEDSPAPSAPDKTSSSGGIDRMTSGGVELE